MESDATDKPVPREINALLSDERLILRETQRAVTPFGGIAVFISFLGKIGFVEAVRQQMPVRWRSPNHIDPTSTFTAFLISVLVGASRFAPASLLRGDRALHARLGLDRFPTDDTIRNLFRQFGMGQVQRLFEPLPEWQMQRWSPRQEGYTLDLDSTVFERYGKQEGALKGHHPRQHGRPSHPPLLAVRWPSAVSGGSGILKKGVSTIDTWTPYSWNSFCASWTFSTGCSVLYFPHRLRTSPWERPNRRRNRLAVTTSSSISSVVTPSRNCAGFAACSFAASAAAAAAPRRSRRV
jgi:hypothetical protein